jgi:DNA-binding transcriptional regulator YiaG
MTTAKKKRKKRATKKIGQTRKTQTKKKKAATRSKKATKKPSWTVVTFKQIEEWRERLGLSKSAMAEALSVTNSTYHNWRRGTTVPHANQQHEILSRLQVLEDKPDGHATGAHTFKRGSISGRGRGPLHAGRRTSSETGGESNVGAVDAPAQAAASMPRATAPTVLAVSHSEAIGRISAAYIASQNEPVSEETILQFVTKLKATLA